MLFFFLLERLESSVEPTVCKSIQHLRAAWHFWHDVAAGESEVVALVRLCEAVVNIWEKQSKRERMYFWLMISEVSTHYWLVSLLPGLWKQRKSWWKKEVLTSLQPRSKGKKGKRVGDQYSSNHGVLWPAYSNKAQPPSLSQKAIRL